MAVLTYGMGTATLLKAELERVEAAWVSILAKIIRRRRTAGVPIPVHVITIKREIYERFLSPDEGRRIPSATSRYFGEKARLAVTALQRASGLTARVLRWRSCW